MGISVIGISHHNAPVEIREAFTLPGDNARQLLRQLCADKVFSEAMVLDTCNRTEVHFVSDTNADAMSHILSHIAKIKGVPQISDTSVFYRYEGTSAVEHLFRVAAALDSQIVGEHQILGQLRSAYRMAREERTAGFFLNKLFHWSFRVGKRSRSETDVGRGSTSVAQAAVDLSQQVFSNLAGKSAMLVGAGATGELAAKALIRCGLTNIIVANRSIERARQVVADILQMRPEDMAELDIDDTAISRMTAGRKGAKSPIPPDDASRGLPKPAPQAILLEQIPEFIGGVDLVICATGSPELVLTGEELTAAVKKSKRSLFIVDIAVPRDVDPRLGRLSNVFLYNIDDLDRVVQQNLEARRREVPSVEAIIEDELRSFNQWLSSLQVTPTIKLLQRRFSMVRDAEISKYSTRLDPDQQELLEQFSRSLCNKILHQPITFLRELSDQSGTSEQLAGVDMIRRVFRLDELEQDS